MRRLIALTATAAVALSLAPFTAQAQGPVFRGRITVPAAHGTHLAGTAAVEAWIDEMPVGHQLKSWQVEYVGEHQSGVFCTKTYRDWDAGGNGAPELPFKISFNWDTRHVPGATGTDCSAGGALSYNGPYDIVLKGSTTTVNPAENLQNVVLVTRSVSVSNAPATPTGVKLGYNEGSDTMTVQWNATTTEPTGDISYRVQECKVDKSSKPCGSWKNVADSYGDTKLSIKGDGPGIYRYRVIALRLDGPGTTTLTSAPASAEGDPTEIEIKEKPATPETTVPQVAGETTETTQPAPRTVVRERPTRRVQRGAPQVVQRIVEEEPGYNTELPYQGEEAISGLPIDDSGDGEGDRAILIPLAGGLVLMIFAGQAWYLTRRANSLEMVAVAGDGSTVEFDEGNDWDWDE